MAINQDFVDQYSILLIKQYWEKPRAKAEIELFAGAWSEIFNFASQWDEEFDLDQATGDRLDKIGSIVGISRTADGVAMSDDDYRFIIRLKIANNVVVGTMMDETRLSIQDVIQFAFGGMAYVVDNYDMTLSIFIELGIPEATIERIVRLKLLPKPAAVRYDVVLQAYDALLRINGNKTLRLSNGNALRIKFTKPF